MSDNPFVYNTPKTTTPAGGFNWNRALDIAQGLVLFLAFGVVIYLFFIIPTQVDGSSMLPNLVNDEVLLSNRFVQIAGGRAGLVNGYDYQRGDIIVFKKEIIPEDLVKRVIGVAGDRVKIENNVVYINGQRLKESYIPESVPTPPGTFLENGQEVLVPQDSFFVMGDNRTNSKDSRYTEVGFVKRSEMKAAPFLRIFPLDKFGGIPRGQYQLGAN